MRITRVLVSTAMLVFIVMLATVSTPAHATDRYYFDTSATSPNGRYVLEATSPDNAGEKRRPFARNFTYTLIDTQDGSVLWTRRQAKNEQSPVSLFLDDQRHVLICTSGDNMYVLNPADGRIDVSLNLIQKFSADEQDKFVLRTTAGRMWAGRSRWSFLSHEGSTYFVVRAWWDRRVIINVSESVTVSRPDDDLVEACDAADRAYVLETLEIASNQIDLPERKSDYSTRSAVATAVHLAGRMSIRDAIPFLRVLEASEEVGSAGGSFDIHNRYAVGAINPFDLTTMGLRREVHLALRRLGEKPTPLPCTKFRAKAEHGLGSFVTPPPLPAPRAERVECIEAGMIAMEVLTCVGAPDFVNFNEQAWEYDMDAETPFTLRVYFKDRTEVDRVERIVPALWQHGETRYQSVVGW
ncbi:MAG: hypothetical protein AAF432_11175 [Planctomycetota bacterium]